MTLSPSPSLLASLDPTIKLWAVYSRDDDLYLYARNVNAAIVAAAAVAIAAVSIPAKANNAEANDRAAVGLTVGMRDARAEIYQEIYALTCLPASWDGGQNDLAPSVSAANDAINFYSKLPNFVEEPELMVSGDGELGFLWATGDIFLNVSFYGDGRLLYFGKTSKNYVKGEQLVSMSHGIPNDLAAFLSKMI